MNNLFKKAAVLTDLHFGLKNNSSTHLEDCEGFIDWFIEEATKEGCETGICLGDWHHNRNTLNLITMVTSIRCLEKLGKAFKNFYFFPGNHDLYYKDKRDVHSLDWGRHIPGITVVNNVTTIGNVTLCPWLVGDEWKKLAKVKSKYIFGHLELPNFYMNAMVQMPDHGQLQHSHFKNQTHVFSGHFHKRQTSQNITYIGNAFPHNYADAGDDERGMMIMEWDKQPEFKAWPDQPIYRTYKLSQIIESPDTTLRNKMHCRVAIDIPITFEEANFIRETFMPQYSLRELQLVPEKIDIDSNLAPLDVKFESVDTIVMNQIASIESDTYNKDLLMEIYRDL